MTGRRLLKDGAATTLARLGGIRLLDKRWRDHRLTVLVYHRIAERPGPDFPYLPEMVSATPAEFAGQVEWARRNFDVVALDDVVAFVGGGRGLPRRPLLITFDDGYLDNYLWAAPVLRAHGLPAVIFIVSGAIGTNVLPWWDEAADLLRRTPLVSTTLPLLGPSDLTDAKRKAMVRAALLAGLKSVPDRERAAVMEALPAALKVPRMPPPSTLFMSWDQVRELVGAGIACQPHTHTHPILTRVDPDRLADELTRSSRVVSEQTGRPTPAFAYPNGAAADFDETVTAAVAAAGYDVAFTMEPGPVHRDTARRRPLEIARVPVVHTDTLAGFQLKTMGWTRLAMRARERRESIAQRVKKPA